jgi:hypothetical protein
MVMFILSPLFLPPASRTIENMGNTAMNKVSVCLTYSTWTLVAIMFAWWRRQCRSLQLLSTLFDVIKCEQSYQTGRKRATKSNLLTEEYSRQVM